MEIITRTAGALQGLFSTTAEEVGTACRLIKRKREFEPSACRASRLLGSRSFVAPLRLTIDNRAACGRVLRLKL